MNDSLGAHKKIYKMLDSLRGRQTQHAKILFNDMSNQKITGDFKIANEYNDMFNDVDGCPIEVLYNDQCLLKTYALVHTHFANPTVLPEFKAVLKF